MIYSLTFQPVTLPGLLLLSCFGSGALRCCEQFFLCPRLFPRSGGLKSLSGSQRQTPDLNRDIYSLHTVPSKKISTVIIGWVGKVEQHSSIPDNLLKERMLEVIGPVASTFPRRCAGSLRAPGILFFTAYLSVIQRISSCFRGFYRMLKKGFEHVLT